MAQAQQQGEKKPRSAAQIAATQRMLEARQARLADGGEGGAKGGAAGTGTKTKNAGGTRARSGTKEGGSKGGAVMERVPAGISNAPLGIGQSTNVDPDTQWYTNLGAIYVELTGLAQLTNISMQAAGAGNTQLANQHTTTIYQRIFELSGRLRGGGGSSKLT